MITLLVPEAPHDFGKRPECLKKGLVEEAILNFNSEWCRAYFILSGDVNHELHSDAGAGIVQGTAILTLIGTVVSKNMPGYMVVGFSSDGDGETRFKNPVMIGNLVTMSMERLDDKEKITKVKVLLALANGKPVLNSFMVKLRKYKKPD